MAGLVPGFTVVGQAVEQHKRVAGTELFVRYRYTIRGHCIGKAVRGRSFRPVTFITPWKSSDRAHQPEIEGIRGRRPLNVPCRMRCDGSMERLEFRLLGFPEFRINGRRVDLGLRKAVALLILLAESQ